MSVSHPENQTASIRPIFLLPKPYAHSIKMHMSIYATINKINKGQFSSIYSLLGNDTYISTKFISALKTKLFSPDDDLINYSRFSLDEKDSTQNQSARNAVDFLNTFPFGADSKVCIVQSLSKKEDMLVFENYIKSPSPYGILVLQIPQIGKHRKFAALLKKNTIALDINSPKEYQMDAWIQDITKSHNLKITRSAVELIKFILGTNLAKIDTELCKIKSVSTSIQTITDELVFTYIAGGTSDQIFKLIDYLFDNRRDTLIVLEQLLKNGQHPILINNIIGTQIRKMIQIKESMSLGKSIKIALTEANIPSFKHRQWARQINCHTLNDINSIHKQILTFDYALKSSAPNMTLPLYRILTRFIHQGKSQPTSINTRST